MALVLLPALLLANAVAVFSGCFEKDRAFEAEELQLQVF